MEGKRGSECLLKPVSNIDFNPLKILDISETKATQTKFKFNVNEGSSDPEHSAIHFLKTEFPRFVTMTAWRKKGAATNMLDNYKYVVSFAQDPDNKHRYIFGGLFYVEDLPNVKDIIDGIGYRLYLDQSKNIQENIGKLAVITNELVKRSISRTYDSTRELSLSIDHKSDMNFS